jgi:predicted DsbA family dithiol-disulfide isomerase
VRIDIVADFVCPWCFLGKRRLDRAIAMRPDLAVTRVWHPFQLNPELPPDGLSRELYLRLKFGGGQSAQRLHAALAAAGAREGIAFAFDRIRRTPNTLPAHRLVRFAAAAGCADVVVEGLFAGYLTAARDISKMEVLAEIAVDAGLDGGAVRPYLAGDKGAADVLADELRARRSGIDAVPCFVIAGDYAVSGAQEPEIFLPLFDLAAAPER